MVGIGEGVWVAVGIGVGVGYVGTTVTVGTMSVIVAGITAAAWLGEQAVSPRVIHKPEANNTTAFKNFSIMQECTRKSINREILIRGLKHSKYLKKV